MLESVSRHWISSLTTEARGEILLNLLMSGKVTDLEALAVQYHKQMCLRW
jgi:hypothetical protein